MRLIIEKDLENMDFEEIILSKVEIDHLQEGGVIGEFKSGFDDRPLNVHVRKETKEDEYE